VVRKVNSVSYQPGEFDAFYHRYFYDKGNKLIEVKTSRDQIEWERDATYQYYKHGPLARTVLGEQQVQGIDYAYTLQGWLKGVNPSIFAADNNSTCAAGSAVDNLTVTSRYNYTPTQYTARQSITFEPGFESGNGDAFDTEINSGLAVCTATGSGGSVSTWDEIKPIARDAFNFSLHYFKNDYTPISNSAPNFANVLTPLGSNASSLYNGNIAAMAVNIPKLGTPFVYNYKYDQLNRLVSMDAYSGLSNSGFTPVRLDDYDYYQERINYDPNGNILTYFRNGTKAGGIMDDLTYQYPKNAAGDPINNRLRYVHDNITSSYTEDIKSQTSLTREQVLAEHAPENGLDNYGYDAIGNLVKDGGDVISWNIYGKITSINKGGNTITYSYDAAGNRITKTANDKTTIYVRDAQGNVLSVYEKPASGGLKQAEVHLYGSSRLGIAGEKTVKHNPDQINLDAGFGLGIISTFTRGEKMLELSNHLGNVLVTISDKKIAVASQTNSSLIDHYEADILSASDYTPFGMQMVGRTWNSSSYRYGFNGKENDNEIKGEGNQQDYGMRIYDPRLGKFLSVDPITKDYPELTPYQFASNSPILGIDLDGLEFANPMALLKKERPVLTGIVDGIGTSVSNTWNFISRDAWKAETWKEAGNFLEESVLDMSAVKVAETPRVDATVQNFNRNVIHGDAYSRSKFLSQTATDLATAYIGSKGMGALSSAGKKLIKSVPYSFGRFIIGNKTLARVTEHLKQFGDKAENTVMLERMRKIANKEIKATEIDINFAKHELRESELMKQGITYEEAHEAVLKEQGMYHRNYEKKLYTEEALKAGNEQLEREAKKGSK
jgi:RHS repeat-associated protein